MFAQGSVMENPEKIEIAGLKTIHKLCNFGADRNMEGCTFTEIVERMFDELAKAQAVPEGFVLVKMEDLELLRDSTLKIKYASLNNDSDRIFSDIEDIQLSIERLIELQEPAND